MRIEKFINYCKLKGFDVYVAKYDDEINYVIIYSKFNKKLSFQTKKIIDDFTIEIFNEFCKLND